MLNKRQAELYENLMNLCEGGDAFYFADHSQDDSIYRIFNYRLASYSDFLQDDALESRGHMFEIDSDGKALRLAAWPFEKFFNLNENPMTMDLDLSNPTYIVDKVDGSLISSYLHDGQLRLKSKGSLSSDQAVAAMELLINDSEHKPLKEGVAWLTTQGYTVNMEYTAPDNRIVIGYEKPGLHVLGVRNNETGDYIAFNELKVAPYDVFFDDFLAEDFTDNHSDNVDEFVQSIYGMTGIEGFILCLRNGQRIKIKTEAYLSLHRTKDNVNSPRRLFETVVNEASDDLRSLFHDDVVAMQKIEEMEQLVEGKYNSMVASVEKFYDDNKHLERKDYAILGQEELNSMFFSLAMMKYVGKPVDYKGFMIKKYREFGIKDEEKESGEE